VFSDYILFGICSKAAIGLPTLNGAVFTLPYEMHSIPVCSEVKALVPGASNKLSE